MAVDFFCAKNGEKSARSNGILLHSAYNPGLEAERFVQGLACPFAPSCVVIIEPAESHAEKYLRKRFPGARLGAIRFSGEFSKSDGLWDFSLLLEEGNALSEKLFSALGEEDFFKCLFFEWPPAVRAWPKKTKSAWEEIKSAGKKAKAVLATREHFARRWLKNKIRFFEMAGRTAILQKITAPVAICASGPSLEEAAPILKKVRQKVFVAALSSAIGVLGRFGIKPDLCISTDGGWWAKKHLDCLLKNFCDVPLALASEAAAKGAIFEKMQILPLCYDDDVFSKKLFAALGIDFLFARRNGTVSGTALDFFLQMTEEELFFLGLDLGAGNGRPHSRPNALEVFSAQKDFRLEPCEMRAAKSSRGGAVLDLYRAWFSSKNLGGRKVFRVRGKSAAQNSLGQIKDISCEEFEAALFCKDEKKAPVFLSKTPPLLKEERRKKIKAAFLEWQKSEGFKSELFPADFIMAAREKSPEEKEKRLALIDKKAGGLFDEIFKG